MTYKTFSSGSYLPRNIKCPTVVSLDFMAMFPGSPSVSSIPQSLFVIEILPEGRYKSKTRAISFFRGARSHFFVSFFLTEQPRPSGARFLIFLVSFSLCSYPLGLPTVSSDLKFSILSSVALGGPFTHSPFLDCFPPQTRYWKFFSPGFLQLAPLGMRLQGLLALSPFPPFFPPLCLARFSLLFRW